ncbi:hypothetical protein PVAND_015094 [Polypedilum vanderplanki]|uniref:Uncharacterized protein n=1 Tax=Polypedilum vanderplanki TaxID=319348 RepID=A0A9J6BBP2_POLVA|nr:hypothetical protein PVAND_015094 [Polypedilum vanderplanki]
MKLLFHHFSSIILIITIFLQSTVKSSPITCDFGYNTHMQDLTPLYCCKVTSFLQITERNASLTKVLNEPNVKTPIKCFNIDGHDLINNQKSVVNFVPTGIEKLFLNLKHFRIGDTYLKEVTKNDLEPFKELTALSFFYNNIEFIEKDLFIHNPHLEFIWLEKNKIKQIWPSVFDHLKSLKNLCLLNNKCVSAQAINSKNDVKNVIEKLKQNRDCINNEYMSIHYPEIYNEWIKMKERENLYFLIGGILILMIFIGAIVGGIFWSRKIRRQNLGKRSLPELPMSYLKDPTICANFDGNPRYSVVRHDLNHTYETLPVQGSFTNDGY